MVDIAGKCSSNETGDILSWKTFELTSNDNVFKQIPTECDGIQIYEFKHKCRLHFALKFDFKMITMNLFVDIDDCLANPCRNAGKCTDLLGGFECLCVYGFKGDKCEENIDDCVDHACENNATCIDGAANYTCDCLYGYKGELCEIAMGNCRHY